MGANAFELNTIVLLSNVAIPVGFTAPTAVVYITTFVERLVSVKFSPAITSTRPVDEVPNCSVQLLNPRPVNCDKISPLIV